MSTRWEGHGELGSLRVRRFRGGWRCTARGEGVLALQAAALDLDGGGAWSAARAWLGRAREAVNGREVCGAAAKRCRSGARAAAKGRRRCRAAVSRGGRDTVSETDAWAHGKIK